MELHGRCFGVRVVKRKDAPNDAVQLLVEDDDNWFETGSEFDAGWIDDMVEQLLAAKNLARITFKP